jgi:hypothetical protein
MNALGSITASILKALGIGFLLFVAGRGFKTDYLTTFLQSNLLILLFALLAINAATLGVVLTKVRDLMDKSGTTADAFKKTRAQMILSIREQTGLIIVSLLLLMAEKSALVSKIDTLTLACSILLPACLAYALIILYDTITSVFVVLDFGNKTDTSEK